MNKCESRSCIEVTNNKYCSNKCRSLEHYHKNKDISDSRPYKIYKIIYEGKVVYIGQTKQKLNKRKNSGYKNPHLNDIIRDCIIELIEESTDVSRERYWINHYISIGEPILNELKGNTGLNSKDYSKLYYKNNIESFVSYRNREDIKDYQRQYQKKYRESKKNNQ